MSDATFAEYTAKKSVAQSWSAHHKYIGLFWCVNRLYRYYPDFKRQKDIYFKIIRNAQ